ncbi:MULTISPECIES: PAS domain-containing sensor histidine kinase [Asticcacaulis]|uniref:PAS domain-containing sensor histidine kinase n=1 Tax=Asticcacaulis TaxID=76890 RepID=UPI001AE9BDE6|nr:MULTISPECIES: PAS domain-containing sensor histidine kinase [Asticcacaulis]MBP2160462.1 sigma-B regulation protein RsbU (phosphoserine phosphatase) [Asticcacaulis solisilvae]MDR6801507.1 sigma-B regulation protein RsbU (phosphoserine phosphatase) [Asticcacaulis sp. BE141]
MADKNGPETWHNYKDDYDSFFEQSPCGFVTAEGRAKIIRCNSRFAGWLGYEPAELAGTKFSDLLTISGKIFYETHLAPLLRMQGFYEEAALDLVAKNGERIHFLVNAAEERDDAGNAHFVRLALFKATDRRILEKNLQMAKLMAESDLATERGTSALREQFIAVLGHDLRNPLGAMASGAQLLARMELDPRQRSVVEMMRSSAERMGELIENVMDFARVRLGGGMGVNRQTVDLAPALTHTVDELRTSFPDRDIRTEICPALQVNCDVARISQLLSNLIANAVTHGATDAPVVVSADIADGAFALAVSNGGQPIPPELVEVLFQPFTREKARPSQNGLGLGLYIAAEIAKAHDGTLEVTSSPEETRFTFRMAAQRI